MKKRYTVEVDKETHEMLTLQASAVKMGKRLYMRLCLINSKDIVGKTKG